MATQTSMSIDDIIEAIGSLSVVELAELIGKFKGKFGVTIAAPVAAAPAAGGAGGGAGAAPAAGEQSGVPDILQRGGGEEAETDERRPRGRPPRPAGVEGEEGRAGARGR